MALSLSERCKNITPSVTLAIDAKAKAMAAAGEDVIGFGAGEPDFDTPSYICDAAVYALNKGKTRYTLVGGTVELRKVICDKLLKENGLSYQPADVIVSNGAKHSLYNALCAILDDGDEVLLPSPCWISYPEMVAMAGGVPVMVPGVEENDFLVDAEALAKYVTPRTKALILNSPNNPNGCIWPRELLEGIAKLAVDKEFYIISDEIYEKLVYDGHKHVSIASLNDDIKAQTIVVNGVSKAYAMTGWRIGYAAGPREVISAMTSFQSHSTSNPNSIAQHAAMEAMKNGEEQIRKMVDEFKARRDLLHRLVNEVPSLSARMPQGAFYIMANVKETFGKTWNGRVIGGSMDFADCLLESQRVAVVPGLPFGADEHLRLSYAISQEKIKRGIERIVAFVNELK